MNIQEDQYGKYMEVEANGVKFVVRLLDGGTFMMGSPEDEVGRYSDEKQHEETVEDFGIGDTLVTQELWEAVMGENPSHFQGDNNLPVECVSWNDCQEFIKKLNEITGLEFELPNEAEWEYMARAGTTTPFWTGDNITTDQANFDGNYPYNNGEAGIFRGKTTPVKHFAPNPWGIHDVHGNLWEFTSDIYDDAK